MNVIDEIETSLSNQAKQLISPTNLKYVINHNDLKDIVNNDLDPWAHETALIDSFILFNFIPLIYVSNRDITSKDIDNIQKLYESKYGSNKYEIKYFQQMKTNTNKYISLLIKVFQIFALSDERKLSSEELSRIFTLINENNNKSLSLTNNV